MEEKWDNSSHVQHIAAHGPEKGWDYVQASAKVSVHELHQRLDQSSRQLDLLNHNLPGAAHRCKNNSSLTILSMSDSFLSMLGYTHEEVGRLFHNHYMEMIYPDDRAMMLTVINKPLQKGQLIELEYRVLCKNRKPIWVLNQSRLADDGSGGECFYCLLMDITRRRQEQEELRLSLERHQIIMDQAADIIFEWDISKDTILFSNNWKKKFGYPAIDLQISERIPISSNIHPEDIPAFVKIMRDTAAGVPYSETEFRIRDIRRNYCWCRIRATTQYDSEGRAIRAVGVIADIEGEKKQKQVLLDLAQKDALTGLYNKTAVQSLVEQRMKDCPAGVKQALLILDVDYFKKINDTYGHLAGDSILSNMASAIKTQIRSADLAGRVGGDEFLIFLEHVSGEAAVSAKAAKLQAAFETLTPEPGAAPVSCSIGAVVFGSEATDYRTIYQSADRALYARKHAGRGGISFYREEMDAEAEKERG